MKLEDAVHNLYLTARDMEVRRQLPRAQSRPLYEKVYQGGLLLFLLVILMVGPIMFFSTLNPTLQANEVTRATLTADLVVKSDQIGEKVTTLYQAGQKLLQKGASTSEQDAYYLEFPELSDTFWLISPSLQDQMSQLLDAADAESEIFVQVDCEFEMRTGTRTSRAKGSLARVPLTNTVNLQKALNRTSAVVPILVPTAFRKSVAINSRTVVNPSQVEDQVQDVLLTLSAGSSVLLQSWKMSTTSPQQGEEPPRLFVVTEKIAPDLSCTSGSGENCGGSNTGVIAIYLGTIYTIGRFLRLVFQDSSKRMIWEELPDTTLLMDLCNGIYIARIQGFLETEYKLYYQLVQIYRSPELLLDVAQDTDQHTSVQPTTGGDQMGHRTTWTPLDRNSGGNSGGSGGDRQAPSRIRREATPRRPHRDRVLAEL